MLRNYLLVTFRNLLKNKVFTLINILGLGIALSLCIVAFFNHMFEYEFDRTHVNFDRIYRITSFRDMQEREQEYGIVPVTLGLQVVNDIPGIEKSARLMRSRSPVKVGNDLFTSMISYVDPDFLDIFTFPLITGDKSSLSGQSNVLVSREMALRLFGEENVPGRTISIINDNGKEFAYTIAGVFRDLPQNSSFRIDVLTHIDNFLLMWDVRDSDWRSWANAHFIMVSDESAVPAILKSLSRYTEVQNRAREDFRINRFNLIPLDDVGSTSRTLWSSGLFPSLHPAALNAPPVMAVFILLIACFNFANTSRSIFSKRLKEIGLRKTFGGMKKQLVSQFMMETFIICILALFAGLAIAEFLVPAYSSLWAYMSIELVFTDYWFFWIFLILLVLVTGFIAGVYPAWYVSSFNPVHIIKGDLSVRGSGRLSLLLLLLQFTISVSSLVMGIVFARNADYQRSLDLGYDRDKLLVISIPPSLYTAMRNELTENPKVISAEGTQNHIGWGSYRRPVRDQERRLEVDVLDIGPGYASTMGLRLLEGRLFEESRAAADRSANSIVVNREFAENLGWKNAVGRTITMYDTIQLTVIGMVENFYTSGLWQKIEPAMMRLGQPGQFYNLAVRGNPADLPSILEYAGMKYKTLAPNSVFEGRLQENLLQEEKDINGSILKVNLFLAFVATLLSLIGMYNLVSLDIIKRTKEIGIRKIQGAPVHILMYIISRKYLFVLAAASVLGSAGGYYLSNLLLDSIWDYFVNISAGMLLSAAGVMVIATFATISLRVLKAALQNPVVSLRYE